MNDDQRFNDFAGIPMKRTHLKLTQNGWLPTAEAVTKPGHTGCIDASCMFEVPSDHLINASDALAKP